MMNPGFGDYDATNNNHAGDFLSVGVPVVTSGSTAPSGGSGGGGGGVRGFAGGLGGLGGAIGGIVHNVHNDKKKRNSDSILERDWPVREDGSRPRVVRLFVSSVGCDVPGGVETLLKIPGTVLSSSEHETNDHDSSLYDSNNNNNNNNSGNDDHRGDDGRSPESSWSSDAAAGGKKKDVVKQLGSRLLRVAKGTTERIERGMTNIAIKADSGKSPDWSRAECRLSAGGGRWERAGATESVPVTTTTGPPGDGGRRVYALPVVTNEDELSVPGRALRVRLTLRSGALSNNRHGGAGKHFLVGTAEIDCGALLRAGARGIDAPLRSPAPSTGDARVRVAALREPTSDDEEPFSCPTDPSPDHCCPVRGLFHPPLRAAYAFGGAPATERAAESAVVLPVAAAVTSLLADAAAASARRCHARRDRVAREADGVDDGAADRAVCAVAAEAAWARGEPRTARCAVRVRLQSPDCVFERALGERSVPTYSLERQQQQRLPPTMSTALTFYPKVVRGDKIGALRFEVVGEEEGPHLPNRIGHHGGDRLEGVLDMNQYYSFATSGGGPQRVTVQVPLYDRADRERNGVLTVTLSVAVRAPAAVGVTRPSDGDADDGLAALVGLDVPDGDPLDGTTTSDADNDAARARRRQRLETMGHFTSSEWIRAHDAKRTTDAEDLRERRRRYVEAISAPQYNRGATTDAADLLTPDLKKEFPAAYRPSTAKNVPLISAIPVNVHVQSLSVPDARDGEIRTHAAVTCGACADHAAGYKKGGLRRLEAERRRAADNVETIRDALVKAVAEYFAREAADPVAASAVGPFALPPRRHVPPDEPVVARLRRDAVAAQEALSDATWDCALRRGNVLSQAIGIGLTSLCAAAAAPDARDGRAEAWTRRGYLICFEGLLSAVGKELGMIEDASVAVRMLNDVGVRFVPADAAEGDAHRRVAVRASRRLRWIAAERTTANANATAGPRILVTVGTESSYLSAGLPSALRDGAVVRFYAVLFEMGIDIRQFGANTSAQARHQIAAGTAHMLKKNQHLHHHHNDHHNSDDDDVVGAAEDKDVLHALNRDALRRLEAYADAVLPRPASRGGLASTTGDAVHPELVALHRAVGGSTGRVAHDVIDAAAAAAARLSGGVVVFCKSGKDRTAMQITLQQARFSRRVARRDDAENEDDAVYRRATLMRTHGTRLAVCEKNIGQPKYAFNALQVKFLPDMLRPPPSVLAGLFKGGQVFTGKGFIES